MALQGIYNGGTGIISNTAYAKVCNLQIDYLNKQATVAVLIFHNESARMDKKIQIGSKVYSFNITVTTDTDTNETITTDTFSPVFKSSTDILQNIYDYIKKDYFKEWKDV